MTAQPRNFERALIEMLDVDGPQSAPSGFLDDSIGAALATSQRRPPVAVLDLKAWPAGRPLGLTPRALRVLALVALLGLAAAAALVGANLLNRSEPGPGSLIVWVPDSTGGGILRKVADDGAIVGSFELPPLRHCPRLLPDGQHAAYWREANAGTLVLQPLDGSSPTVVRDTTFRDPGSEMWSPDGWRVALRFQQLRIVDASDGTVLRPATSDRLVAAAWTPSGELTVARQLDGEVEILALDLARDTAREVLRFPWNSGADGYPFLAWSPDSRYILYSIHEYADVIAFDTQTATSTALLTGGPGLYDPRWAWSVDGRVALVDHDGQVVITRPDGARLATVRPEALHGLTSIGLRWAPDGSSLALTDYEHVVITVDPDGSNQQVHPQVHDVDTLAWSPDSSWLAVQIRGSNEAHQNELQIELYSTNGLRSRVLGPFASTDGDSGSSWSCLEWEEGQ